MWLVDEVQEKAPYAMPVAVSGASYAGLSLQEWVYVLTLVYLVLQIGKFFYKAFKSWRSK